MNDKERIAILEARLSEVRMMCEDARDGFVKGDSGTGVSPAVCIDAALVLLSSPVTADSAREYRRLKAHISHPQIHLDYYKWLPWAYKNKVNAAFIEQHCPKFEDFHAIAMWVFSSSREVLKNPEMMDKPLPE